jgi:hypothetical protein
MPFGDILWRIYYEDGSTYCSAMGDPDSAPPDGVLAIVQLGGEYRKKRDIVRGWNCYFWHIKRERWVGADQQTIHWRLKKRLPMSGVCDGIGAITEDYQQLVGDVLVRDVDFPSAELAPGDAVSYLKRAVSERACTADLENAVKIAITAGVSTGERHSILMSRPGA